MTLITDWLSLRNYLGKLRSQVNEDVFVSPKSLFSVDSTVKSGTFDRPGRIVVYVCAVLLKGLALGRTVSAAVFYSVTLPIKHSGGSR